MTTPRALRCVSSCFPLGLRMEEMPAARGITVSHETVRQWVLKFGRADRRLVAPAGRHIGAVNGTSTRSS
ncbi:transposase-like protein [Azospirillum lipoferum]|nr:transposase-like protein [Azospirillum lipoferum]